MQTILDLLAVPLGALMRLCYSAVGNYILAIIIFTLITRIVLLPVSLWTHRNGIKMVELMPELNQAKIKYYGDKEAIAEETQRLYKKYNYHPLLSMVPMIIQIVLLMGVVGAVKELLGESHSSLTLIPAQDGGWTWLMPLLAGLAALILSFAQSKISPLQREQSVREQVTTGGISVAISLFLGIYVMVGVAVYWIAGNLISILQQLLLNWLIKPAKYVDYPALEESKRELAEIESLTPKVSPEDKKREKADYKRFFSVANKHLVFYSEKSGFYKYFQNVIEYLLSHSNVIIHYVTSDPKDQVFEIAKTQTRIKPYYIGEKRLITLFMKMDADMVCMTTPDLDNLYLKRSYVRKDIEYVYFPHGLCSSNMCSRKGAYDHYDTIFCAGQHQFDEHRETEQLYHLPQRTLVPCGYGLLDNLLKNYEDSEQEQQKKTKKTILIAPSWQEGNILETCIDTLIDQLYSPSHYIILRPHPEFIKRFPTKMERIVNEYRDRNPEQLMIESDFSSNVSVFTADLLITDWSSIAQEFAFTTKRPVLFINTPMKVLNPDYVLYKNQPTEITWRNLVGRSLELNETDRAAECAEALMAEREIYRVKIEKLLDDYFYHIGSSGEAGAKYIISRLTRNKKTG